MSYAMLPVGQRVAIAPVGQALGDWLPTFVTPDDARNYIGEIDAGYKRLDSNVRVDEHVAQDFKIEWGSQLASWTQFAETARPNVGWLNTKATMEQTDRWAKQLGDWSTAFEQAGGKIVGPPPLGPGQGIPGQGGPSLTQLTGLVVAAGVLAAIVVLGPKLPSFRDVEPQARAPVRRRIAA
jgi:hypothetical protein